MFRSILKAVALAVACTVAAPGDSRAEEFPGLTTADLWKANAEYDEQFFRFSWREICKSAGLDPAFAHCYVNRFRINEPGVRSEAVHRTRPYLRDEFIVFNPVMGEVKFFPKPSSGHSFYYVPYPYDYDLWFNYHGY